MNAYRPHTSSRRGVAVVVVALVAAVVNVDLVCLPSAVTTPVVSARAAVEDWQAERADAFACSVRTFRALDQAEAAEGGACSTE